LDVCLFTEADSGTKTDASEYARRFLTESASHIRYGYTGKENNTFVHQIVRGMNLREAKMLSEISDVLE
jgi:hypothetical protein